MTNVTYCTGCWQSCVEIKCTLTRNRGSWILSLFSSSHGHKVTFSQLHGKLPLITKRGKISSDHIRNANKEVELQKGRSVILTISYKVINWEPNHLLSHSWEKQSNRQVLVEHSNKLSEHHRFDFCWEPSASLTSFPSHQRLNTTANHWHLLNTTSGMHQFGFNFLSLSDRLSVSKMVSPCFDKILFRYHWYGWTLQQIWGNF